MRSHLHRRCVQLYFESALHAFSLNAALEFGRYPLRVLELCSFQNSCRFSRIVFEQESNEVDVIVNRNAPDDDVPAAGNASGDDYPAAENAFYVSSQPTIGVIQSFSEGYLLMQRARGEGSTGTVRAEKIQWRGYKISPPAVYV